VGRTPSRGWGYFHETNPDFDLRNIPGAKPLDVLKTTLDWMTTNDRWLAKISE